MHFNLVFVKFKMIRYKLMVDSVLWMNYFVVPVFLRYFIYIYIINIDLCFIGSEQCFGGN